MRLGLLLGIFDQAPDLREKRAPPFQYTNRIGSVWG